MAWFDLPQPTGQIVSEYMDELTTHTYWQGGDVGWITDCLLHHADWPEPKKFGQRWLFKTRYLGYERCYRAYVIKRDGPRCWLTIARLWLGKHVELPLMKWIYKRGWFDAPEWVGVEWRHLSLRRMVGR